MAGTKRVSAAQALEQQLMDVMRHLNLAVAVVANAREQDREGRKAEARGSVEDALVHVRGAISGLESAQRAMPRKVPGKS